jgi:N-acetylmuramoyl-L-alanine amidase
MKQNWCAAEPGPGGPKTFCARRFVRRFMSFAFGMVLAAGLFAGAHAQATTAPTTPSVASKPAGEYEAAVQALALGEIVSRPGDPSLVPADAVSRAEMAVYLARALKLADCAYSDFVDVERGDWGFGAIGALHRAKVIDGTSPLTFSPDRAVSRQEAAALLVAALDYSVRKQGARVGDSLTPYRIKDWLAGFKDRGLISPQYATSVAIAYRVGLFDAPAGGWLFPSLGLTQRELALVLERAFLKPVATSTAYPKAVEAVDAYSKLSRGSTGPLVLMLESKLAALHYPCGPVDGTYDYRTKDAVMAFQKYERLKRTGVVDGQVWARLLAAQAPTPVLRKTGRRVEVDLTRQVLMMINDNKVIMTIHVSTGKYGTPTGEWRIRTRTKGWRPTSLGPVWSPCYFMARNAIHGYPSVPTYPASHNCVRTPIWVQNSLVDQIELGIPVDVFYNRAT